MKKLLIATSTLLLCAAATTASAFQWGNYNPYLTGHHCTARSDGDLSIQGRGHHQYNRQIAAAQALKACEITAQSAGVAWYICTIDPQLNCYYKY